MIDARQNPNRAGSKRRWLQYSLGTLLLVTTILAICLGVWVDHVRKQERAVNALQGFGGVQYRHSAEGKEKPPGPEALHKVLAIDFFDDVTVAFLVQPGLSDAHLEHLAGLPKLETLVISGNISGEGLRHVSQLHHLKSLQVFSAAVTDEDLACLQSLTNLTELKLCCSITEAGLRHLTPLKQLERLEYTKHPPTQDKTRAIVAWDNALGMSCDHCPLAEVLDNLSMLNSVRISLDQPQAKSAPVTMDTKSFDEALRVALGPLRLDWTIGPQGLLVTSQDALAKQREAIAALREAIPSLKTILVEGSLGAPQEPAPSGGAPPRK